MFVSSLLLSQARFEWTVALALGETVRDVIVVGAHWAPTQRRRLGTVSGYDDSAVQLERAMIISLVVAVSGPDRLKQLLATLMSHREFLRTLNTQLQSSGFQASIQQYEAHHVAAKKGISLLEVANKILKKIGLSTDNTAFQIGFPVACVFFIFCICQLCGCCGNKRKVGLFVLHAAFDFIILFVCAHNLIFIALNSVLHSAGKSTRQAAKGFRDAADGV